MYSFGIIYFNSFFFLPVLQNNGYTSLYKFKAYGLIYTYCEMITTKGVTNLYLLKQIQQKEKRKQKGQKKKEKKSYDKNS